MYIGGWNNGRIISKTNEFVNMTKMSLLLCFPDCAKRGDELGLVILEKSGVKVSRNTAFKAEVLSIQCNEMRSSV